MPNKKALKTWAFYIHRAYRLVNRDIFGKLSHGGAQRSWNRTLDRMLKDLKTYFATSEPVLFKPTPTPSAQALSSALN